MATSSAQNVQLWLIMSTESFKSVWTLLRRAVILLLTATEKAELVELVDGAALNWKMFRRDYSFTHSAENCKGAVRSWHSTTPSNCLLLSLAWYSWFDNCRFVNLVARFGDCRLRAASSCAFLVLFSCILAVSEMSCWHRKEIWSTSSSDFGSWVAVYCGLRHGGMTRLWSQSRCSTLRTVNVECPWLRSQYPRSTVKSTGSWRQLM